MATAQEIARLIIKIQAETAEIALGFRKAEDLMTTFVSGAKKILAGLSLAVIAKQFVQGIEGARAYAAEMGKMAERASIGVTTLSALADAADDVGISQESLAIALKRLNASIFEARKGAGEQLEIFQAIGISLEELRTLDTGEIFLRLSEALKNMGDVAERPAIALKLLGRAGDEMVPFMIKGRDVIKQWMDEAKASGKVIDEYMSGAARELGRDINNLKDNVQGFGLLMLREMLPSLLDASRTLLSFAGHFRDAIPYIAALADAVKVFAVTLASIAIAKNFGIALAAISAAAGSTAWAIRNLGFVVQYFATVTLGPLLMNPLTWLAIAVAALAGLWIHLGKATAEARVEHEKYAAAIPLLDAGQTESEIAKLEAYLNQVKAIIVRQRAELEKESTAYGQAGIAARLDDALRYAKEAESRLALLKKHAEDVRKASVPQITDQQALDKIAQKTAELKAEMVGLSDPVAGNRAQLDAFIESTTKGALMTPKLTKGIGDLKRAFEAVQAKKLAKEIEEATSKATMSDLAQAVEGETQRLKVAYDQGILDVRDYYEARRNLAQAQADQEAKLIEARKAIPGTTEAQRLELDAQIRARQAQGARAVIDLNEEERKGYIALWDAVAAGDVQQTTAQTELQLLRLDAAFEDGLVTIRTYYETRRALAAQVADEEIGELQRLYDAENDVTKKEERLNALRAAQAKARKENLSLYREETVALRDQAIAQMELASAILGARQGGFMAGTEKEIQARYDKEQTDLDVQHARLIKSITEMKEEGLTIDGVYYSKADALAEAHRNKELQDETLHAKRIVDVYESRVAAIRTVTGALGDIFGNLYELSGRKLKAFFYLQKGAAIAEAFANTALAATKAMAQTGILSPYVVPLIWAQGMTQIAVIAAQTIQGFDKGGLVRKGGGHRDDVPAMLSRHEYVQPESAVRYYGVQTMEAIRRMLYPKEWFSGMGRFAVATPRGGFAEGGLVTVPERTSRSDEAPQTVNVNNTWVFSRPDMRREIIENTPLIEGITVDSLRKAGVIRNAIKKYTK